MDPNQVVEAYETHAEVAKQGGCDVEDIPIKTFRNYVVHDHQG